MDVYGVGTLCRSKLPITRMCDDRESRLCRIKALLPEHRWRNPEMPEYKVELLSLPVSALLCHSDLEIAES